MQQGGHGHLPALAKLVQAITVVDLQVVEDHLVKAGLASDLDQRPYRYPFAEGAADGHHEVGQAVVLVGLVGAQEDDHPLGEMGQGGPHLVTVDHPLVTLFLGKGLHAGEVGAGARLAEALAPDILAGKQLRQQRLPDLFAGVVEHRRRRHAQANHIRKEGCAGGLHFLVGHPLTVLAPAPADLHGVIAAHQTGLVSRFLPGLQIVQLLPGHDLQGGLRQSYRRLCRRVAGQPLPAPGTELRLFGRILAGIFRHAVFPLLARLVFLKSCVRCLPGGQCGQCRPRRQAPSAGPFHRHRPPASG